MTESATLHSRARDRNHWTVAPIMAAIQSKSGIRISRPAPYGDVTLRRVGKLWCLSGTMGTTAWELKGKGADAWYDGWEDRLIIQLNNGREPADNIEIGRVSIPNVAITMTPGVES